MHPRRVDPLRQQGPVFGEKRRRLEAVRHELDAKLSELDNQLKALADQRRHLANQRRTVHRTLWPNLAKRGRRAAPDGSEALPPVPHDVVWLFGRRLRSACIAILARLGPLPLVELHGHLHRLGFGIAHSHPVKALADALGYEAEQGRAARVARGTYALAPGTVLRSDSFNPFPTS